MYRFNPARHLNFTEEEGKGEEQEEKRKRERKKLKKKKKKKKMIKLLRINDGYTGGISWPDAKYQTIDT